MISETQFARDPYKAGAAQTLNKAFDTVTADERRNFKRAFFHALVVALRGDEGQEFIGALTSARMALVRATPVGDVGPACGLRSDE
jgi:hypothetical protein